MIILNSVITSWGKTLTKKAVGLKNSRIFADTFFYEDVPYRRSRALSINLLRSALLRKQEIEDFMFHWIIQNHVEYSLPVRCIQGYLAGKWHILDNGQPIKLNNLFLKYPETKSVLFHGRFFAWTGEYAPWERCSECLFSICLVAPDIKRRGSKCSEWCLIVSLTTSFSGGGDCRVWSKNRFGSVSFAKVVVSEVLLRE